MYRILTECVCVCVGVCDEIFHVFANSIFFKNNSGH